MSIFIDAGQVIEWTVRFLAFYILVDSAGRFYYMKEYKPGEIWDWREIATQNFYSSKLPAVRNILNTVFSFRNWFSLLLLRCAAGLVLLINPHQGILSTACLIYLFILGSFINLRERTPFNPSSDNRFSLPIFFALASYYVVPTEHIAYACLWFIALQSCLSYVTAGACRLANQDWRKGNGILNVVRSEQLNSSKRLYFFIRKHPLAGRILSWSTLGIECLFPLVLVVGAPYYVFFILWGFVFHLAIAVFLRLHKFFWVWLASYPAIIYIAQQ